MMKNISRFLRFTLAVAIAMAITVSASAQSQPPLKFLQDIPLTGVEKGDFDHFAIDLSGNRLFLTGEKQNSVFVMDTKTNKLIHTIKDVDEPHSMLYLPASGQLWVVAGGDGTVRIYDSKTYALTQTIKSTEGADSSAYDADKHLFYVVTGGEDAKLDYSMVSIFDTAARKHVGDIKVDSKNIEAISLEKGGPRIFANIRDKNLVGVLDREKKSVFTTWTLGDLHGNTPIIYDNSTHRVFVVGRQPGLFEVLDGENGKIVATLPTTEMTDDMAFDPASKRIYVVCNDFTVVYVQKDPDHYEELARIPTGFRAKTAILVTQLHRFYVAAPGHENIVAAVKVYEVQ